MSGNRKPIVTIALVVINIAVFLYLSLFGMTEDAVYMLEHGAMYVPYIAEQEEYYRLFTCMFLHFDISHLMNNMVMLFFLGSVLEEELGKWKYILLYFISGLGGNMLSYVMELNAVEFVVSAGASGAIFGIIGGLFYVVLRNHGRLRGVSGRGIVFMVVCSLYHGFTSTGIDNMAHIGGLLSGFLIAVLVYRKNCPKDSSNIIYQ